MREHVPEPEPRRSVTERLVDGRTKYLAILMLLLFGLGQFLEVTIGQPITRLMGIDTEAIIRDLELWRFLSYMWFHSHLLLLLVNTAAFLFLGSYLERVWPLPQLVGYIVVCALIAGFCSFLIVAPQRGLIGITGGNIGLCLICWRDIPNMRLFDRVRMRQGVWIVGALVVFIHYLVPDHGGNPNAALALISGLLGGWVWVVLKPVVKTYYQTWNRYRERKRRRERTRLRKRMEELLEKISEEGIDALTEEERSTLHEASRRLDEDTPGD